MAFSAELLPTNSSVPGHQLSRAEFLELVLQDELLIRQQCQIERRVKSANFREVKTLDHFDWSFNPAIPRK